MGKLRFLLATVKNYIKNYVDFYFGNDFKMSNNKRIILMGTPTHGNLGDQAIVLAEEIFLKENFPEYDCYVIPQEDSLLYLKSIKKQLNQDDILFMHGGGNFGSLYPSAERMRRFISSKISKNKIIFFPQSVFFENTLLGRFELKRSIRSYSRNKNVTLTCREKESFSFAVSCFKNNKILLTPDIVLYLLKSPTFKKMKLELKNTIDEDVLMIMRDDREKLLKNEDEEGLFSLLSNNQIHFKVSDTHIGLGKYISDDNRLTKLLDKWNEYTASKMIITDRLHGMIFSILMNKPVIGLNINNWKIQSTYESWLKDIDGVDFLDVNEITRDKIKESIKLQGINIEESSLFKEDKFLPLKECIKEKNNEQV